MSRWIFIRIRSGAAPRTAGHDSALRAWVVPSGWWRSLASWLSVAVLALVVTGMGVTVARPITTARIASCTRRDVLDRGGGQLFDNSSTVYASDSLPARDMDRLNRTVDRFYADDSALAYWWHAYEPTGQALKPIINLHTVFDPDVPYAHALSYQQRAQRAGMSANLLTVPVPRYGHCAFTLEELMFGFATLVQWANPPIAP